MIKKSEEIKKRSIKIFGHATSVSLEEEYWDALHQISAIQKKTIQDIIESLDPERTTNLSSAIRLYILRFYKKA